MRRDQRLLTWGAFAFLVLGGLAPVRGGSQTRQPLSFEAKLAQRVERYNAAGRSLTDAVLDLAFEYQLPLGVEYVDRGAALRPIEIELRQKSVREILGALVATAPEYRIDFSGEIVHLFSPVARQDSSNLLNTVIPNFEVSEIDPYMADMELICALHRQLQPPAGCGGSHPIGSPQRISIHLRRARLYEILDAIAAKQGAVWFVNVRPETLSKNQPDIWHIYELVSPFDRVAKEKLQGLFPPGR